LLEEICPDLITLEMSPFSLRFRLREGKKFRKRILAGIEKFEQTGLTGLSGIMRMLDIPFEYRACAGYAEEKNIEMKLIDLSKYSRPKLLELKKDLENAEILKSSLLFADSDRNDCLYAFNNALHSLKNRAGFDHDTGDPAVREMFERDCAMAEKIIRFVMMRKYMRIAHAGGWEHLVCLRSGNNLGSLLDSYFPRIFLSGYGEIT
jgi:hypothetical protein